MLDARSLTAERESATWQGKTNGIRPPPHHMAAMRSHGNFNCLQTLYLSFI